MTPNGAFVITTEPVGIRVAELSDDRVPEGMVGLGTWIGDRLVARCAVEPEAAEVVLQEGWFDAPVPLALAAEEAHPGLQCRLFAVIDVPSPEGEAEDDEGNEPWAASVPSWEQEAELEPTADGQAAVLLGHVVRFARDRKHPDNLALEAADVLATIVQGQVTEVVDKVLEDLLGS